MTRSPGLSTQTRLALAGGALACLVFVAAVQAQTAPAATGPLNPRTCKDGGPAVLSVRTVPPLVGVRFELSGEPFHSDRKGIARITVSRCGTYSLKVARTNTPGPGTRAKFARWGDESFLPARPYEVTRTREIEVGFDVYYLVKETFIDLQNEPVAASRVTRVIQSNSLGTKTSFPAGKPQWLSGSRIMRRLGGLRATEILYSVRSVIVDGTNVVRRAQQRFYPTRVRHFQIRLLLYSAQITARDRLFGFAIGSGLALTYPDGHVERHRFGPKASLTLEKLPRGTYDVVVKAPGLASTIPIALTRNQVVELKVVSYFDVGVVLGLLAFGAVALVLVRRPRLRRRLRWLLFRPALVILPIVVVLFVLFFGSASPAAAASPALARSPVPTLAYYYIWFDRGSWNRAKIDYPLLGRYSSDDTEVMRRHIEMAKSAGIDGFIVSWKATPVLNRRLAKLIRAADAEDFKLAIIYQGLNFEREPLLPGRIANDLLYFIDTYAHERPFDLFAKPIVIWSGTEKFSRRDVSRVARKVRRRVLLLASEKQAADYEHIADFVDGDAYYWSSVNPETFPGYHKKLRDMSDAIHARAGLWIAPASPGFDARLVGGNSVVDRRAGATLRQEFSAAISSSPDAVGLISWNEFSENSHIEPSRSFGTRYLRELADIIGVKFELKGDFDSSEASGRQFGYTVPLLVGFLLVLATGAAAIFWRRQIRNASQGQGQL